MAVVVSGAVLLGIVFSILALHIFAAVDTVKIRRRLQQKQLHLLTILFTGSITISLYACVQVCKFLTFAVIGPSSELITLWYIADSVCESVYVCHCAALVMYTLCFFLYTSRVKETLEVKNSLASISLEDGNSSSFCSHWKSPHTSKHFQPPASPQTVHPADHDDHDQPVTVDNHKQSYNSHFNSTFHFLITIAYFISILVEAGFLLYLFSIFEEYHTDYPTTSNPDHLSIVKIAILLLGGISVITVNFLEFDFSLACEASILINCFLNFLNICIPFMCEYQGHGLLSMLLLLGVFNAALISYYLAIELVKQNYMD